MGSRDAISVDVQEHRAAGCSETQGLGNRICGAGAQRQGEVVRFIQEPLLDRKEDGLGLSYSGGARVSVALTAGVVTHALQCLVHAPIHHSLQSTLERSTHLESCRGVQPKGHQTGQ